MERDRKRSPQQLVHLLALFIVSFDIMKRSVHVRRSVKGDEVILLNFQTMLHVESIELCKLAKPKIYGWESWAVGYAIDEAQVTKA